MKQDIEKKTRICGSVQVHVSQSVRTHSFSLMKVFAKEEKVPGGVGNDLTVSSCAGNPFCFYRSLGNKSQKLSVVCFLTSAFFLILEILSNFDIT